MFTNLLIVVAAGLLAPLALGFFPRVRLPAIVLEIVLDIVIGPSACRLTCAFASCLEGMVPLRGFPRRNGRGGGSSILAACPGRACRVRAHAWAAYLRADVPEPAADPGRARALPRGHRGSPADLPAGSNLIQYRAGPAEGRPTSGLIYTGVWPVQQAQPPEGLAGPH
jgi:hypothetical protein